MPFRFDLPTASTFEKLEKRKHDRGNFCCGVEPLDTFLKTHASQAQERYESTTHVICSADAGPNGLCEIHGFITLRHAEILIAYPPPTLKLKENRINCELIARMAVAKDRQNSGLGTVLISLALRFFREEVEKSAFPVIVVDAKNEQLVKFYERFGFTPLSENRLRLILPTKELTRRLPLAAKSPAAAN